MLLELLVFIWGGAEQRKIYTVAFMNDPSLAVVVQAVMIFCLEARKAIRRRIPFEQLPQIALKLPIHRRISRRCKRFQMLSVVEQMLRALWRNERSWHVRHAAPSYGSRAPSCGSPLSRGPVRLHLFIALQL